jgi:anti-sigma factor RsiW
MKTKAGDLPSDELLTAYLDGQLDAQETSEIEKLVAKDATVRQRLAVLRGGDRPFREALAPLLEMAPRERLEALAASAASRAATSAARPSPRPLRWTLAAAAAALFLAIGGTAGFLIGQSPPAFLSTVGDWDEWRQSVARQISLYSDETLAAITVDPVEQEAQVARLGRELKIELTAQALSLPGLSLKRVDRLAVGDRPLLQLLYQGDKRGPLALCIIEEAEGGEREGERIAGMNLFYWTAGRHGFLIVGGAPMEEIEALANVVEGRLLR